MIVWRGLGILIVVAAVVFFFGVQLGLEYGLKQPELMRQEIWPLILVLVLTGIVAIILDPHGHKGDSLFFIPTRFWGYIVVPILALCLAGGHYSDAWTADDFWSVLATGEAHSDNPLPTELRTWTDRKGRVMSARLFAFKGEDAVLVKEDGRKYRVPIRALSVDDQAVIAKLVARIDKAKRLEKVQEELAKDKSS